MTLDQFIQQVVKQSGKTEFTMADVRLMTEVYIQIKKAAAEPFTGWQAEASSTAAASGRGREG